MRVTSLGIRTVPVLSVAKKLVAPRPSPAAPAAKCGLICSELTMTVDWVMKNFCLVVVFFSPRSNHRARGAY